MNYTEWLLEYLKDQIEKAQKIDVYPRDIIDQMIDLISVGFR